MVTLTLFENSLEHQTIRTILSFVLYVFCDLVWLFISERKAGGMYLSRFWNNKVAYFNVWITIAIVFGVSVLATKPYSINEVNDDTQKNYVMYGLLIGLLIYVPLYNWIISCGAITGFSQLLALSNTGAGVVLSGFICWLVFRISVLRDLMD